MSIILTRDRPMTLIQILITRVGGIIQISHIGLTLPQCPKWMLGNPLDFKELPFPNKLRKSPT